MTVLSRRQFSNNGSSTLAVELVAGATSLQVASSQGALFPQPSDLTDGHYFATLEDESGSLEIVKVTARTSDTMTIVREQEGTTSPASFPVNTTRVELRVTANLLAEWLLPAFVRYLAGGLGLTFEGPDYPGTPANVMVVEGLEDPARAGKLLLRIGGDVGSDSDVHIRSEASRDVKIQDVFYPKGTGATGQIFQLTAADRAEWQAPPVEIPALTQMLFHQAAAPAGWTQIVTAGLNERLVSISTGVGAVSGGDWDSATGLTAGVTGDTTLTSAQSGVAAHDHTLNNHTHGMQAHTHSMQAHTHNLGNHRHDLRNHTHGMDHTHGSTLSTAATKVYQWETGTNNYGVGNTGASSRSNTTGPSVNETGNPDDNTSGTPSVGSTGAASPGTTAGPSGDTTGGTVAASASAGHSHPGSTITSDLTWRPENRSCIICEKDA